MVLISLVPVLNLLYFYISTFQSMCAVHNMAVFCSSLNSCCYYIIIIIIIIMWRDSSHLALASSTFRFQLYPSPTSLLHPLLLSSKQKSNLMFSSRLSCGLSTGLLPWNLSSSTFFGVTELSILTICSLCNLIYFTFYCYGINAKDTHRRRVSVVVTVTMTTDLGAGGSFS